MADVVGTAFVRIKALTKDLAKDIEKSVKKGMKDAKLDKAAGEEGEKSGEAFSSNFADSAKKNLNKQSKGFIPEDVFKNISRNIEREWDVARKSIDDKDLLPDIDEGKFKNFFRNTRNNIRENIGDFKRWRESVKSDTSVVDRSLIKLTDTLRNFGGGGGGGGGLGGISRLGGRGSIWGGIAAAIVASLPIIQDIGSAILAYATGLVAQIGFLVTALGGLGVAAGAALGSALAIAGPLALAFASPTAALEEFKDSMKAAGEEFLRIGTATQATLLPALDDAVFQMGELVPLFSEFGFFVGRAVGDYAKFAAGVLTSEKAQGRFGDILQSSLRILDVLFPMLINIGDLLSGIWVAAIPASERFVETIGRLVGRWTEMVNVGLDSGTLTETFDTWYDRAELLGSALGNLTGALFDILQVGANSSDNVFVRFDEWAERYRDFTESEAGQNRLSLIFENSLAVMREVNGVIADLFDGIFGRLGDLGGVDSMVEALQGFREILPDLQEDFQDLLGTIETVTDVVGARLGEKFTETFEAMREPVGRLVFAILDFFEAIEESGSFETFLKLMQILTDTLSVLLSIPAFGTFIGYLIAFGAAAKIATFALGPFVALLGPFLSIVKGLAAARVGVALASTASGMSQIAAQAAARTALGGTATGLSRLTAAAAVRGGGGIAGLLRGIVAPMSALGPVGIAAGIGVAALGAHFYNERKRAQEFAQEVRQARDALGELNGGLNITAEGIAKYVTETSRFASNDQLDDLGRMKLGVAELAEGVTEGTLSYVDFANIALKTGEVHVKTSSQIEGANNRTLRSLEQVQEAFDLTDKAIETLATGGSVIHKTGESITLAGNDSILESYEELFAVIAKGSKDSFGAFVANAQNARLLGVEALNDMAKKIEDASSDVEAAEIMTGALAKLKEEAIEDTKAIVGLSDATRDQARAQATLADGTVDVVKENQILRDEQSKLFKQIRENLDLFASAEFEKFFRDAKQEVRDFSGVVENLNFKDFKLTAAFGGLDALLDTFPNVGSAASDLFAELRQLPQAEFNAAATALNLDAESLKTAMNGAQQAIIDLQETALSKLPSIQEALDQNLKTREDGTQYFDTKGFSTSATERINATNQFADDIQYIFDNQSAEAARLAIQQGPESARALAEALSVSPNKVNELLGKMEAAETSLSTKIEELFGDALAAEYFATAQTLGGSLGVGISAGLNSPATIEAIGTEGTAVLDTIARGFRGRFQWVNGELQFINTGRFFRTSNIPDFSNINFGLQFSEGGFVGFSGAFNSGPAGTDTIPAWLTPGEFVLRRSVAQAIPPGVLNSLNAGSPALVRLLSSYSREQVRTQALPRELAGIATPVASTPAGQASAFGPGSVVIYAQGTSAHEVYQEFNHRTNWKLTSRGDQ